MHKMGPWASGLRKLVAQAQDLGLQAHEEAWGTMMDQDECGLDLGLQAHDEGAHRTVMDKDECRLARTHCSAH